MRTFSVPQVLFGPGTLSEVHAAFEAYVEAGCDVLIAVGGGGCIDAAKGVAILSAMGGDILDHEGVDQVTRPLPPMVMCPSTGGTGADVSQFAVITDTARRIKATLIGRALGRALVPAVAIPDPRLLTRMDAELTAATGLDALSHGIEAYASVAASFLTDQLALSAIERVASSLTRRVDAPHDLGARTEMARASLQAGMAFTNSLLGLCHALSHQIGGCLDLPHGVLNGVLLPHVMAFNAPAASDRYVDVARAFGVEVDGMDPEEAADAACSEVQLLVAKLGSPRHLSSLGVRAEDFADFAEHALDDACLLTNPRSVDLDDARELFHAAL